MRKKDIAENSNQSFSYKITDNILSDICYIIDSSQKFAFVARQQHIHTLRPFLLFVVIIQGFKFQL